MKLTIITLPFIFSVAAIANPLPEDVKPVPDGLTAAASVTCTITGDGVRYRRCPKTSCEAVGQYAKGTRVTFTCYTTGDTVSTTSFWDKTTAGYYVTEAYIDPDCAATVTTPC